MVQIFEPLEVRNSDSTNICQHIRNNLNASLVQNLVSSERRRSIGTLEYDLSPQVTSVVLVECTLRSARCEHMTLLAHDKRRILELHFLSVWVVSNCAVLREMLFDFIGIQAFRVVNGRIFLDNANDSRALGMCCFCKAVSNGTKALHNDFLAFKSSAHLSFVTEIIVPRQLLQHDESTETGRFPSAFDAALSYKFASHNCGGV